MKRKNDNIHDYIRSIRRLSYPIRTVMTIATLLLVGINTSAQTYEDVPVSLGMRVASVRYTEIGLPAKGVIPVFMGNKMGFVDYNGEPVGDMVYEKYAEALSYRFHEGRMKVKKNGKYGFVNDQVTEVIPCQYDEAMEFENDLVSVKKNGYWGYINTNNEQIVPFGYKKVYPFSNGMAAVLNETDSIGFINTFGLIAIPFEYDNEGTPAFRENGLCKVRKNGKWTFIDKQGTDLGIDEKKALALLSEMSLKADDKEDGATQGQEETTHFDADEFEKKLEEQHPAKTKKSVEVVYPNVEMKKLMMKKVYLQAEAPYESIGDFNNGYAIVTRKKDGETKKFGMIKVEDGTFSKIGKEVIPCEFDNIEGPYHGPIDYFIVSKSYKFGAYKTDGTMLLPCVYQHIGKEGNTYIQIQQNDLFGFADKDGKVVIPCQFYDASPFNELYTSVLERKKDENVWNFIDKTGKVVTTDDYEYAGSFENGVCPVRRKGKNGFVTKELKSFGMKYGYSFSDDNGRWSYGRSAKNDLIPVLKENKFGFINMEGKEIIKPVYEDAFSFVDGKARVRQSGKFGLIDATGKTVLPFIYDNLEYDFDRHIIVASTAGKKGVYAKNAFVLPCEYSSLTFFDVKGGAIGLDGKTLRYCKVVKDGKTGIYSLTDGKFVIECKYPSVVLKDNVFEIDNGTQYLSLKGEAMTDGELSAFVTTREKGGRYCLVSHGGKQMSGYVFDHVGTFQQGFAPVKIVNLWGMVDKNAKIVIPCIYEDVKLMGDGLVSVRVLAKRGLTDTKGEQVMPKEGTARKVEWISTDEVTMRLETK